MSYRHYHAGYTAEDGHKAYSDAFWTEQAAIQQAAWHRAEGKEDVTVEFCDECDYEP